MDRVIDWKFHHLIEPLFHKYYWLVFLYGGRTGGKSHAAAEYIVFKSLHGTHRILCTREIQDSIESSVMSLIKDKVEARGISDMFRITKKDITCLTTGSRFVFHGMDALTRGEKIKGFEKIDIVWVEEAESLSRNSIDKLIPTIIRNHGAQIIFTFNRKKTHDPVWDLSTEPEVPELPVFKVKMNWYDNPFRDVNVDLLASKESKINSNYDHIWNGEPDEELNDSLIRRRWVDAAYNLYKESELTGGEKVALDPSGTDGKDSDESAFGIRRGNAVTYITESKQSDPLQAFRWSMMKLKEKNIIKCESGKIKYIYDAVGVGAGVTGPAREYEDKLDIVSYMGNDKVTDPGEQYNKNDQESKTNKEMFDNIKAQDWYRVKDLLYNAFLKESGEDHGDYMVINPDIEDENGRHLREKLKDQLCQAIRKESANIKIKIDKAPKIPGQSKPKSPNLADVVVMLFSNHSNNEWIPWSSV